MIAANGVTLSGATSSDVVADLQTAHDGNLYTVDEAAGSSGQSLVVDFTGVEAFNWVQILGRYQGSSSHVLGIHLEVSPFDGSTWHQYGAIYDQVADWCRENHGFFVPDDSVYINSGVVKVKVDHPSGNSAHDWIFDEIALYQ